MNYLNKQTAIRFSGKKLEEIERKIDLASKLLRLNGERNGRGEVKRVSLERGLDAIIDELIHLDGGNNEGS
jgi:hypothetical protein